MFSDKVRKPFSCLAVLVSVGFCILALFFEWISSEDSHDSPPFLQPTPPAGRYVPCWVCGGRDTVFSVDVWFVPHASFLSTPQASRGPFIQDTKASSTANHRKARQKQPPAREEATCAKVTVVSLGFVIKRG